MDKLLRIGLGNRSYVFSPDEQASIQGDFGDTEPTSNKVLGGDGGVYAYGYDRSPLSVGNVQAYFWKHAQHANDMAAIRRELQVMQSWGPLHLVKQFMDGTQVWTWGIITNVRMPQSVQNVPHRMQQVQINFHCPLARWYGHNGSALYGVAEGVMLSGLPFLTPKIDRVEVGDGDTVTITNNGTMHSGAYIRWEAPEGVSITNPTITRENDYSQVVDSIQYTGTLEENDVVDIEARGHLLQENNVVVPNIDKLTVLHGAWLELPPGTSTLNISGTFVGGDGLLTVDCWDTYT